MTSPSIEIEGGKGRGARWLRLVLWNVAVVLVGLVVLDLIFGSWVHDGFYSPLNTVRSATLTFDVSGIYPDSDGIAHYTRDADGLRGSYDTPGLIEILTLGGSTTDQRFLSDGETWQDALSAEARDHGRDLVVGNAGVDGHSTFGHLIALERWLPGIEGLDPRIVLFYVGINDVLLQNSNRLEAPRTIRDHFRERSALYHVFRTVKGVWVARQAGVVHASQDLSAIQWVDTPRPDEHLGKAAQLLEEYSERVALLTDHARELGWTPVFVTQPSWFAKSVDGVRLGADIELASPFGPMIGLDRAIFLDLYNAATMVTAQELDAVGIDLAGSLYFEDGDFYDVAHNTPVEVRKIGRFLYEALAGAGLLDN